MIYPLQFLLYCVGFVIIFCFMLEASCRIYDYATRNKELTNSQYDKLDTELSYNIQLANIAKEEWKDKNHITNADLKLLRQKEKDSYHKEKVDKIFKTINAVETLTQANRQKDSTNNH